MNPQTSCRTGARRPRWCAIACALALLSLAAADLAAQPARKRGDAGKPAGTGTATGKADGAETRPAAARPKKPAGKARAGKGGAKVFDFTGFELAGSVKMPQLLYFLDRAEQELERASLERRSFVPELVRSIEEENL